MTKIKVIKEEVDSSFYKEILRLSCETDAFIEEYQGVLNDSYIVHHAEGVHIDEEEPTDYIILFTEPANTWSDKFYMIRTNDERVVEHYEKLF